VEVLRAEGAAPDIFWYGPNIHPFTEYKSRKDALEKYAADTGLKLLAAGEYALRQFVREVFPVMESPALRCKICYRLRMEKTAAAARENGYDTFSTSLLISPHQDHEALRAAGEEAAAKYGLNFLYRDFRPLFSEGRRKAREMGMYMQKYCGCVFSEAERYGA
jgi:predicted adenine nucleotide alpha hydrolase (AANH) superfamily ATPase